MSKKEFFKKYRWTILSSSMFLWGVITGRTLPQWQDVANGQYWIVYGFFSLVALGILLYAMIRWGDG